MSLLQKFIHYLKAYKKELCLLFSSSILSIPIAIFIYEIYTRNAQFAVVNTRFDEKLGWAIIPSRSVISDGKKYSSNSLGFRSKEVDRTQKQILLVGDSVTWGIGVSDDETASYYLSLIMPEEQVLNMGVPGYGIDQYYLNLKRNVDKLNPKLITVVLFSGNDLWDMSHDSMYGKNKPFFMVDRTKVNLESGKKYKIDPENLNLIDSHISQFSCMNMLSRGQAQWMGYFIALRELLCPVRYLDYMESNYVLRSLLLKVVELASSRNSGLLFVLTSLQSDFQFKTVEEFQNKIVSFQNLMPEKVTEQLKPMTFLNTYGKWHLSYPDLYNLQVTLQQMNLPHIDFHKVLQQRPERIEEFYVDGAHLSPTGNRLLAQSLYDKIKSDPQVFNPLKIKS